MLCTYKIRDGVVHIYKIYKNKGASSGLNKRRSAHASRVHLSTEETARVG